MTVLALLERLEVNPESVLVIVGDQLVTRDARLADTDDIEIRPVISGGAPL
jgi:sulfur carrier protein